MKEISMLIERALKYLDSSKILIESSDYESAVSRAYYTMFYSAEAILLTKNISSSSHKGVISNFGEHFVRTGVFPKEMGKELNRSFGKRQLGDYAPAFVISKEEAEKLLEKSIEFVDNIRKYLKDNSFL